MRTGARRYATEVAVTGAAPRRWDPAPAYDDEIPHDLVHYLVEVEAGLRGGVFGRAAGGAGGIVDAPSSERRRLQRRADERNQAMARRDSADMARSEELAGRCDVAWRRRRGVPAPAWADPAAAGDLDDPVVTRVLAHLEHLAPLWRELPVGAALVATWPGAEVRVDETAR